MQQIFDLLMYGLTTSSLTWISLAFVIGLVIGSFLNVVIHRLPIMLDREWRAQATAVLSEGSDPKPPEPNAHVAPAAPYNLFVPRSACIKCGTLITASQNIPLISYALLRGKCAKCGVRISPRYPVVELGTAVLSALVAWKFGFTWYAGAAMLLTWALVALSVIDIDHQLLPDDITLPLLWAGLLLSLVGTVPGIGLPVDPRSSILGAAFGYLSLWSVYHVFKLLTGKEGMGYGDFKLLAALGAWLGWKMLLLIILLSAFTGAVVGIVAIVARGRDRNIPIPFGPYLAGGGWIALMWGQNLLGSYLRASGM